MYVNNYIHKESMDKMTAFSREVIEGNPRRGKDMLKALYLKIARVTAASFHPSVAPVLGGHPNRVMMKERMDQCIELVLNLKEEGWMIQRLLDDLERVFFRTLRQEEVVTKGSSWGVRDPNADDFELDYTEKFS